MNRVVFRASSETERDAKIGNQRGLALPPRPALATAQLGNPDQLWQDAPMG